MLLFPPGKKLQSVNAILIQQVYSTAQRANMTLFQ